MKENKQKHYWLLLGSFSLALMMGCTANKRKNSQRPHSPEESLKAFVVEFHQNPKSYIDESPVKHDDSGNVVHNSKFSEEEIASGRVAEIKDQYRTGDIFKSASKSVQIFDEYEGVCDESGCLGREALAGRRLARNRVESFFDEQELPGSEIVTTLQEMEAKNLREAELSEEPWSDDYWAIYKGILGARYEDQKFGWNSGFDEFKNYIMSMAQSFLTLFNNVTESNLNDRDLLSPAEKYDLLVGHFPKETNQSQPQGVLTPTMWAQGQGYFDANGKVESWMGICHGWAPAAYMLPAPKNPVDVKLKDGSKVTFYPSDIKGLGSYLWSNTSTQTSFLGGRCNEKGEKLKKDKKSGAIVDEKCFDVNPKNWHLAIINQIGVAKRSFVLDATYDYEVWNQPVYAYSYKYFNPQTGDTVSTIEKAKVTTGDWDAFSEIRNKNGVTANKIVGIAMTVKYMVETDPNHKSDQRNAYNTVRYMYDLEIEETANGDKIVGGEWYSNKHPDFIWNPVSNARPMSKVEGDVGYLSKDPNKKDFLGSYNAEQSFVENVESQVVGTNNDKKYQKLLKSKIQEMAEYGKVSTWIIEGLFEASVK